MGVIERLEKLLNAGATHPPMTPNELRALIAVAKAARECKLTQFHMDTCDKALDRNYPCNCGHEALRAALAALEEGERG